MPKKCPQCLLLYDDKDLVCSRDDSPLLSTDSTWYIAGAETLKGQFQSKEEALQSKPVTHSREWLFQLPEVTQDFIGRINELNDLLTKVKTGGLVICGLQGMGGVGKTALAVKIAHELKNDYPDAQIFLNLQGVDSSEHSGVKQNPLSPVEAMWHVIRSFHSDDHDLKRPESDTEVESAYRTLLNGKPGDLPKRAILLFDNARDFKQVKPLVPPPNILLLVTSRQRFDLPGMHRKDLGRMQPPEAEELLLRIAPRIGRNASKIAELCGHLPLALELTARALKVKDDLSPEEIIERIEKPNSPLRWKELQEVERSFNLSYELLSKDLQKLWRALAIFPETFDTAAAAAVWRLKTIDAKDRLVELRSYSLIEWDEQKNRYRLHDLARDFANARLDDDERELAQRHHAEHFVSVLQIANQYYVQGGGGVSVGLALFDTEWGNIHAGLSWAKARNSEAAKRLRSDFPDKGMSVLFMRQRTLDRIDWLETALEAAQTLGLRAAEGRHYCNLARAFHNYSLEKKQLVIPYLEEALQIAREIGEKHDEGQALGNLGVVHRDQGQLEQAMTYFVRRLTIARQSSDEHGEATTHGNIGLLLLKKKDYQRALEHFEQQLSMARQHGFRHLECQAIGNKGQALRCLGDTENAINLIEQSLHIACGLGARRAEAAALGHLGKIYQDLGNYVAAKEKFEESLRITRDVNFGRAEKGALLNLADVCSELGEKDSEPEHYRSALEYYTQIFLIACNSKDVKSEGLTLWNMAQVYEKLGNISEACSAAQRAEQILNPIRLPVIHKIRKALKKWCGLNM